MPPFGPLPRRTTVGVRVGEGDAAVTVGGGAPIVVQSMTNTDTADIEATARQIAALARAGSELVRITVDRDEAAAAVPHIRDRLRAMGVKAPLIGDFHYIGHKLLADHPACAEALDKYRINPGNVGFKNKRDPQFGQIVEIADPQRQGGAHRRQLGFARPGASDPPHGRKRAQSAAPLEARAVTREAMVRSALLSAARAEEIGLERARIILSAKVSAVQDLITVYRMLGRALGLRAPSRPHRSGHGLERASSPPPPRSAFCLQEGLGDTIRISLTPEPGGDRTQEVRVAQELLQTMGFRIFAPQVAACPGCGRTTSTVFQELARDIEDLSRPSMPQWRALYPGVERLNVAVMGCIVNGPGESKHADIGISLPGTGEAPAAPVFVDGVKTVTLRGPRIAEEFKALVDDYVIRRYGPARRAAE